MFLPKTSTKPQAPTVVVKYGTHLLGQILGNWVEPDFGDPDALTPTTTKQIPNV